MQYACPLCKIVSGAEREAVVYEDSEVVAALSLHQKAGNRGSLLVFPRAHVENVYGASPGMVSAVFQAAKSLSLALKRALSADGVTIVQNNEPAGGQDVWHLHVHVVPRYQGDEFQARSGEVMSIEERAKLPSKVRAAMAEPLRPCPANEQAVCG